MARRHVIGARADRERHLERCRGASCLALVIVLALAAGPGSAGAIRAAEPFESFLERHCVRCHGPKGAEGELRLDRLSRDFTSAADTHHWAEVVERVNSGEMPPEKEPRPTQQEIAAFVTHLHGLLAEGRATRMAARPPVTLYRLSRREYENTVYDLLGVRYDPTKPGELNADTLWHGYERLGSELSLSPSHVDRYVRAAGIVLDRAFPAAGAGAARTIRKTADELASGDARKRAELLARFGIKRPVRYLLFPGRNQPALAPHWFGRTGPEHSGLYKLRIQASGIRPPGGQLAHLSIGRATGEETVDGLVEFDVTAPEDSPQVYEFEVFLEMPVSLSFCVAVTDVVDRRHGAAYRNALQNSTGHIFTHSSDTRLLNPSAPQMFDNKGNGLFSTVLLDWVEWEGPVETAAESSRRAGLVPPEDASPETVAEHLRRFAARAWRRPVEPEELAAFLGSHAREREAGETTAEAFRAALAGVLTSRHFIYLVEGDPAGRERLTDWELASRLSYFLWSSMPDDALLAAAGTGGLAGDGLAREVGRLLADAKVNRFIDDFSRQWLQLHRLGMFPPDKKLYPTYDAWLETSMRAEPVEFFRALVAGNLPVDGFIDADWTIANARLCEFYGLPEPKTSGFQRVSLAPEAHRGGLLTMGAVLGLTSDGTRHRPVHRGVWVSETILGRTPPPPPANVSAIEPSPPESPKATLRQKIEAHRSDANCAACHARIDPLGLAWDNYDAVGRWRTHEQVPQGVGADPAIDASGTLPDGRSFADPVQFKRLLLDDREQVARAFIEHLCTYALRRVLTVDDRADVAAIVAESKRHDFRVADIVRAVALSDLLRKR